VVAATENIVALCDVDERRAASSFNKYPKVKQYRDYRKMLDEMDRSIDAVIVSTTNHTHAPASLMAMRRGKHVYCEKPLTHTVREARLVAKVAAEKKVATQMGTQIHAGVNFRRVVELVQSHAIGPVRQFHAWCRGSHSAGDRPRDTPPVPAGLDWDLWLGPAPFRPYHPCYVPHGWHSWWDFGGGLFGNMGCHYLDLAFWALGLRYPRTIEASGSPVHVESTPAKQHVCYEFSARGILPALTLTWTHGIDPPSIFAREKFPAWAWGVFVGDAGMLLVNYDRHVLWPQEKFTGFKPPEKTIPPSIGHHREWIAACKTGSTTSCNFDYSGAVTEAVLLGNIAYRVGCKLEWDPLHMKFPNCPEAERYLQREYRPGWSVGLE
jgi:predicted dehydrogenase